jgi:hypothetical protein
MAAASTVIGIIGVTIAAAGAAASVVQGQQAADAQEKALEYNAAVQRNNAVSARQESTFAADRIRKRNRLLISKQKATYAKGGVLIDGTPEDVIFDSEIEGELDALAALYSGDMRALSAAQDAQLSDAKARAIDNSRGLSTANSILGSTGQIASASANIASQIEARDKPTIDT